MVTQTYIAEVCGIDVSSVNKILNEKEGPVFRKETIKMVRSTAKRLGYKLRPHGKKALRDFLAALFPKDQDKHQIASMRGVTIDVVERAHDLIRRA